MSATEIGEIVIRVEKDVLWYVAGYYRDQALTDKVLQITFIILAIRLEGEDGYSGLSAEQMI